MDIFDDPDIAAVVTTSVGRGEFATLEEARQNFLARLDRSLAQAKAGKLIDAEEVFDRLQRRMAAWPHAAE